MYIIYLGCKVRHMKTRKILFKKYKKVGRHLKIHKGGRSSGSHKSSDSVKRTSASSTKAVVAVSSAPRTLKSAHPLLQLRSRFSRNKAHSEGDSTPKIIDEDITNKLKKMPDKPVSMTSPEKQNLKRLRRRLQANIPQAPPILLTPQGHNLVTTYTPTMDIVDNGWRMPVTGKPSLSAPVFEFARPFSYIYDRPLPLSFLPRNEKKVKSEDRHIYSNISIFPSTYSYLSQKIYYILERMGKTNLFAKVLVIGKLRDELIACINITSVEAMQGRLFMTIEDTKEFMRMIHYYSSQFSVIGPSPTNPMQVDIPDINVITPNTSPADPNSYRVVGYNKHPMFRAANIRRPEILLTREKILTMLSKKQQKLKGEDFAYVFAHGSLSNELSPEMKILANKYLRIIEVGKAEQSLSISYNKFMIKMNDILRNPEYYAMFDNTDEGEIKRSNAFKILCPYFRVDRIVGCNVDDTFNLVDITHDRYFSGHVEDIMLKDDTKVTYKSLKKFTTMGIFVPTNYNADNSTKYLAKKELYKLYPGTTFFTKNTGMKLVETLVDMAVRGNKRINLIISSCAVNDIHGDDEYDKISKPGNKNIAIKVLTSGKIFLSTLNMLMSSYIELFTSDGLNSISFLSHKNVNGKDIFAGYSNYVKDGRYDNLFSVVNNINSFYENKFLKFKRNSYTEIPIVYEVFSFAGIYEGNISKRLIQNNVSLQNEWYYPYINELIKVKIFLMNDFKNVFSARIMMIKTSMDIFFVNLRELRQLYGTIPDPINQHTCDVIDSAILKLEEMLEYFNKLSILLDFIIDGFLYEANTDPDSFANHLKYREMKKEYDETFVKKIYEELAENLDYDRYEGENVGFGERVYKATHVNPLSPGKFRKKTRHMYKFKTLPNYDEARRRRITMKKQLYDGLGIGKHAQRAKKSSDISV